MVVLLQGTAWPTSAACGWIPASARKAWRPVLIAPPVADAGDPLSRAAAAMVSTGAKPPQIETSGWMMSNAPAISAADARPGDSDPSPPATGSPSVPRTRA
ncbi:MAG: hypothetical protein U0869_19895 [Chloroflexota bacterium]